MYNMHPKNRNFPIKIFEKSNNVIKLIISNKVCISKPNNIKRNDLID